jgi:uncharacterized delta-60 repeat protein
MKKFFTLFLSLSFTYGFAQQVPVAWVKDYNGPADNDDEAVDMVVDANNNAYVVGTSFATNGTYDIVTVMYTSSGVQQWVASYNGPGNDNDAAAAIAVDASGNVYVTGRAKTTNNLEDIVTIKYNSAGVQQWAMTYNGPGNNIDEGFDIAVDASGNVYVTGYVTDANIFTDMMTIKYNSAGVQQWATPFNGTGNGNDRGHALILDGLGNLYVCGKGNETTSSTLSDIVTIKYNCSNGAQVWSRSYDGGNDNDYGRAITMDNAGNIIVTGQSYLAGDWFDYATIKYDAAGTQQWVMRYNFGSQKYEDPTDIITDPNNNVYVTGMSQGTGNNTAQDDFATVKYSPTGTQVWVARYTSTGNNDDRGYGIGIDDTNNIYVTGYVTLSSTNKDFMTIKYDNAGNQKWTVTYDGGATGIDEANSIGIGSSAEVYVAGFADIMPGTATNNDIITIKYATNSIGFAEYQNTFSDIILYPNPSTGNSTISITSEHLDGNSKLFLSVYDVTGREIVSQKEFSANNKFATFDLSTIDLSKGVYVIKVNDDKKEFTGTGKLVIQ